MLVTLGEHDGVAGAVDERRRYPGTAPLEDLIIGGIAAVHDPRVGLSNLVSRIRRAGVDLHVHRRVRPIPTPRHVHIGEGRTPIGVRPALRLAVGHDNLHLVLLLDEGEQVPERRAVDAVETFLGPTVVAAPFPVHGRGQTTLGVVVVVRGQTDLAQVVGAGNPVGRFPHPLHRRHEHADQYGNDGNHHQELDQREAAQLPQT